MLRQLKECEVPDWLADLTAEAITQEPLPLRDMLHDSVYYPSCGFDSDPIKHLGGNVFSFVYVDYGLSRVAFMKALHFSGYDLVASRFVAEEELAPNGGMLFSVPKADGDPRKYQDHIKAPFCLWAVFQRRNNFGATHGPTRFSLLFVMVLQRFRPSTLRTQLPRKSSLLYSPVMGSVTTGQTIRTALKSSAGWFWKTLQGCQSYCFLEALVLVISIGNPAGLCFGI